ncbi:MAG: hypothetical protein SGCHY_003853 [Lobulomycetales sp.]
MEKTKFSLMMQSTEQLKQQLVEKVHILQQVQDHAAQSAAASQESQALLDTALSARLALARDLQEKDATCAALRQDLDRLASKTLALQRLLPGFSADVALARQELLDAQDSSFINNDDLSSKNITNEQPSTNITNESTNMTSEQPSANMINEQPSTYITNERNESTNITNKRKEPISGKPEPTRGPAYDTQHGSAGADDSYPSIDTTPLQHSPVLLDTALLEDTCTSKDSPLSAASCSSSSSSDSSSSPDDAFAFSAAMEAGLLVVDDIPLKPFAKRRKLDNGARRDGLSKGSGNTASSIMSMESGKNASTILSMESGKNASTILPKESAQTASTQLPTILSKESAQISSTQLPVIPTILSKEMKETANAVNTQRNTLQPGLSDSRKEMESNTHPRPCLPDYTTTTTTTNESGNVEKSADATASTSIVAPPGSNAASKRSAVVTESSSGSSSSTATSSWASGDANTSGANQESSKEIAAKLRAHLLKTLGSGKASKGNSKQASTGAGDSDTESLEDGEIHASEASLAVVNPPRRNLAGRVDGSIVTLAAEQEEKLKALGIQVDAQTLDRARMLSAAMKQQRQSQSQSQHQQLYQHQQQYQQYSPQRHQQQYQQQYGQQQYQQQYVQQNQQQYVQQNQQQYLQQYQHQYQQRDAMHQQATGYTRPEMYPSDHPYPTYPQGYAPFPSDASGGSGMENVGPAGMQFWMPPQGQMVYPPSNPAQLNTFMQYAFAAASMQGPGFPMHGQPGGAYPGGSDGAASGFAWARGRGRGRRDSA